jgi:orotate phosphoribosyltransferase
MQAETASKVAAALLEIKAVRLNPSQPFTWASGLRSPIYCDNRQTLSVPAIRTLIRDGFADLLRSQFPGVDGIAGVATAGIAHGALVADVLGLPFIYVRSEAKKHGLGNRIEGDITAATRWAVIEDLVSTGGSSLAAAEAVREAGGQVDCLLAIFTYGFAKAGAAFAGAGIPFQTLTGLEALLQKAVEINYLQPAELGLVKEWQANPEAWSAARQNV